MTNTIRGGIANLDYYKSKPDLYMYGKLVRESITHPPTTQSPNVRSAHAPKEHASSRGGRVAATKVHCPRACLICPRPTTTTTPPHHHPTPPHPGMLCAMLATGIWLLLAT